MAGGDSAVPAWFADLPDGERSALFRAAVTKKVTQNGETRNAIAVPRGAVLRREVTLPAGAGIEVAMTLLCPPSSACSGASRFEVRVRQNSGEQTLLSRTVSTATVPAVWHSSWVDLSHLAGQPVTLSFAVTPLDDDGAPRIRPLALWGDPLLTGVAAGSGTNVLLISVDTLRADRLGSYGCARPTSPHLDRFAAEGVRFALAISQAPWTTPSHMSLLTSLYPSTHRLNRTLEYLTAFRTPNDPPRALSDQVVTLAELLHAHDYRTLALTGGATVSGALGFSQGFDIYREDAAKLTDGTLPQLETWLTRYGRTPFFLFFHTFEVHAPYRHLEFAEPLLAPSERAQLEQLFDDAANRDWMGLSRALKAHLQAHGLYRREITSALYDGGVRFMDAFLGELLTLLRRLELDDRTLVVVTSDHGDEFGEHDPERIYNEHCVSLYDEITRVPLLMRGPGLPAGTVVAEPVELIDVAPTVLALLGVPRDRAMQGVDLTPRMTAAARPEKDWAFSESTCKGPEWKALRTAQYKYLMALEVGDGERGGMAGKRVEERLFDLRADPAEQHPVTHLPDQAHALRRQLEAHLRDIERDGSGHQPAPAGAAIEERLRALGYVE
jgi:arylsulfatase A-like enzyme